MVSRNEENKLADNNCDIQQNLNLDNILLLKKNVVEFGKFSFNLEERREQSLITQSGHLLTVISILSAALLMALPILIENTVVPKNHILIATGIVFAPMVFSMILCVIAQWRFGYQTMMNASDLQIRIQADLSSYTSQAQYDHQWVDQLTEIQKSKKKNNDIRVCLIKASICLLLIAVVLMIEAWLLFIILNS